MSKLQIEIVIGAIGICLIAFLVASFPIFNEPFGGCAGYRVLTIEPGCSIWPEILLGSGVALVAWLTLSPFPLARYAVLALIIGMGLMGGPEVFKLGLPRDLDSLFHYIDWAWVTGGLAIAGAALLTDVSVRLIATRKKNRQQLT